MAESVRIRIKAVPGASRDSIAGLLGDRLKVRVSAAPEGGQANKAIVRLLAKSLGIKPTQVTLVSGQTNPEKVFELDSVRASDVCSALGADAESAICEVGS